MFDECRAARGFRLATLCAMAFSIVKLFEYTEKVRADIVINSNDFYMYYFVLTGIHFMHVLIGIGLLTFMARHAAAGAGARVKPIQLSGRIRRPPAMPRLR